MGMNIELNTILANLAEFLDIPESYFERARSRYEAIGTWLERDESVVSNFAPEIYPQGSFRLGTVIKPLSDTDEYDIDLVCRVTLSKAGVTQKRLKTLVGSELAKYVTAHQMKKGPAERRRSWRLNYADEALFHLDVLPSIPEQPHTMNNEIAITDNQEPDYDRISFNWVCCNPIDYAEWFKKRMEIQWQIRRKELASNLKANVNDVPEYKIKTPLQQVVQLLKRHRDVTYNGSPNDKPVSILITTLAAQAYNNEANTLEALVSIVTSMADYIEERNGVLWVENPVNPSENFADKWQEYPQRQKAFFEWLTQVEIDVLQSANANSFSSRIKSLSRQFGETFVNRAVGESTSPTSSLALTNVPKELVERQRLFLAPHRQTPRWDMKLDQNLRVEISAKTDRKGFRPDNYYSDGTCLPKNTSLRFTASTNSPKPYTVYWQVVNTGDEAIKANAPRGGFYQTSQIYRGKRIREESTLYTGRHWVECFIVVGNVCVARSGEFVVNIA